MVAKIRVTSVQPRAFLNAENESDAHAHQNRQHGLQSNDKVKDYYL